MYTREGLINTRVKSCGFVKYGTSLECNVLYADIFDIFKCNSSTKITQQNLLIGKISKNHKSTFTINVYGFRHMDVFGAVIQAHHCYYRVCHTVGHTPVCDMGHCHSSTLLCHCLCHSLSGCGRWWWWSHKVTGVRVAIPPQAVETEVGSL